MITDIEDFFTLGCGRCDRFETPECSTQQWVAGLAALREACRDAGLVETVKWGHPCYTHQGRNVALIGAFREDFRLSFMDAALLKDPEGVLEKQGPNTAHANMIRFTEDSQVAQMRPVIDAYLREAIGYVEGGVKAPVEVREVELPEELIEALASDPELSEAFDALTPGRQRSYAIVIGSAKKPETRVARIEKLRPKVFAGKGAQEY